MARAKKGGGEIDDEMFSTKQNQAERFQFRRAIVVLSCFIKLDGQPMD